MPKKKNEIVKQFRRNLKKKMIDSMGGKCQVCGYSRCHSALEFHHINPAEKEIQFSSARTNFIKIELILKELKKCILLCNRCHRELHAGIITIPENYSKLDLDVFGKHEKDGIFYDIQPELTKEDLENGCNLTVRQFCKFKKISHMRYITECARLKTKLKFKTRRRFEVDKETLKNLIETKKNFCEIGRMFGVTDNAIRKRAKLFGLM